ncbi:uncharacterized protein LOC131675929 [Topomyia yanbarensis]|uniref:uncharacterized protein LOC131675929 n=1 Tax=Topomyia yanbarensis TaxID=2498891 RepID=UPI00273C85FC|nr:uncharacterized protein LOC131675929 [Topomyia yanbarensis]
MWRTVNALRGKRQHHTAVIKRSDGYTDKAEEVAEELAKHYSERSATSSYTSSFQKMKEKAERARVDILPDTDEVYNSDITLNELLWALDKGRSVSTGPDSVGYPMLRQLPLSVKTALLGLLNRVWRNGCFPASWRTGIVVPIPKPNTSESGCAAFRPITLVNCIAKVFERIVNRRLTTELEAKGRLDKRQHAFRASRGIDTYLAELDRSLPNNDEHCMIASLDLSKAYDTTWRFGILRSLLKWKIGGRMYKILNSFLADRKFRVNVRGHLSREMPLENGVPQGRYPTRSTKEQNAILIPYSASRGESSGQVGERVGFRISAAKSSIFYGSPNARREPSKNICIDRVAIPKTRQLKIVVVTLDRRLTFKQHCKLVKSTCDSRDLFSQGKAIFVCCGCKDKLNDRSVSSYIKDALELQQTQPSNLANLSAQVRQLFNLIETLSRQVENIVSERPVGGTPVVSDWPKLGVKRRRGNNGQPMQASAVRGTKSIDFSDLSVPFVVTPPPPPKFWLYLSGFQPLVTVGDVQKIVARCLDLTDAVDVVRLVSKEADVSKMSFISFKIGLDPALKEQSLDASTWPSGLLFREFVEHQRSRDESNIFSAAADPRQPITSNAEAPAPLDRNVLSVNTPLRNCSGPEVGDGSGGFQPAIPGEYNHIFEPAVPDYFSHSSRAASNNLRIYYQNVRGLRSKIDTFFLAVSEAEYDIIVLTETWLNEQIYSAQLFGHQYAVFRTDRSHLNSRKTRGGGVLVAVSLKLNSYIDPATISNTLEQLWVIVDLPQNTLSIGVIYLPPDRRFDAVSINDHLESLGSVSSRFGIHTPAILFGDYNQSNLQWRFPERDLPFIDPLLSHMPAGSCALIDGFNLQAFTQINTIFNRNERLLDFVLANDTALPVTTVSSPIEPLIDLDADHPALTVTFSMPTQIVYEEATVTNFLDFRRADYATLNAMLSIINWHFIESSTCIDEAVEHFSAIVENAVLSVVPAKPPPQKPPWSNRRLRALKRARSAALRKYCSSRSPYFKQQLNITSNRYRHYNHYLYNRHVKRTEDNLRRNPKLFWSFVNSKRKETGLPRSMFLENATACNESEKCNLFAEHFKQVFHDSSATSMQIEEAIREMPRDVFDYSIPHITESMVSTAMQKLKLSFAAGPDGIPSSVLKRCALTLCNPLAMLFNLSVQQCEFPARWKFSHLFPVLKKGDKRNVSNYRGITSLCACSKLFEIIVNDTLFASCKSYIDSEQHGFYPKRSVSTNLMQFTSNCLRNMDAGWQIDTAYMDLKAAFDRVDHGILLGKLQRLGISAFSVAWFRSYLTNRSVQVRIGSTTSESFTNRSGVPQGSNLGPLLFSIFINDVASLLPSDCRLFYADDTKIFKIIKCLLDCLGLQRMLHLFEEWCTKNFMGLSIAKCSIISFHRKTLPIIYDYQICGCSLTRTECVKDLGVSLDREMTFRLLYDDILSKANRQLGFIFKIAREFRDPFCLKSLYCSLVRSLLESNAVIWSPYHANWIARIEGVQRKFVKYALRFLPWRDPINLPPYEERCRLLDIESLEVRRITSQGLFAAKLLTGDIDSSALLTRLNLYAPERQLRRRNFLFLESRNTQYGQHDPLRFVCSRFNELADFFDFNVSTNVFRQRVLDNFRVVRNV